MRSESDGAWGRQGGEAARRGHTTLTRERSRLSHERFYARTLLRDREGTAGNREAVCCREGMQPWERGVRERRGRRRRYSAREHILGTTVRDPDEAQEHENKGEHVQGPGNHLWRVAMRIAHARAVQCVLWICRRKLDAVTVARTKRRGQ